MDSQELLFNDTEFHQLGRLWHEVTIMSNFMETLRTNPELVAGMWSVG